MLSPGFSNLSASSLDDGDHHSATGLTLQIASSRRPRAAADPAVPSTVKSSNNSQTQDNHSATNVNYWFFHIEDKDGRLHGVGGLKELPKQKAKAIGYKVVHSGSSWQLEPNKTSNDLTAGVSGWIIKKGSHDAFEDMSIMNGERDKTVIEVQTVSDGSPKTLKAYAMKSGGHTKGLSREELEQ